MKDLVIIRGAGDLATGIIQKLFHTGYSVLALELDKPMCIRRQVAFSECVYTGEVIVEGIKAIHIKNMEEFNKSVVNILVDPFASVLNTIRPKVFIDATLAKKDLGINKDMADLVIGVGPPFIAGVNCHVVVETKRGHDLGRLIYAGSAAPDTKVPGNIGGYTHERVIHAPATGILKVFKTIGDEVEKDEVIAQIYHMAFTSEDCDKLEAFVKADNSVKLETDVTSKTGIELENGVKSATGETSEYDLTTITDVTSKIPGFIRGMLRDNTYVEQGLKIADIDPRLGELDNCYKVSDKARNIAGGVLEAILRMERVREDER